MRIFHPDDPEDLAYLKKLAKDTRGDENRCPELNLRIYGRPKVLMYPNGCPILEEDK